MSSIPAEAKNSFDDLNRAVDDIFSGKFTYQNQLKRLVEHYKLPMRKLRAKYIIKHGDSKVGGVTKRLLKNDA